MRELLKLELPLLKSEFMTTVRLATGGVCSAAGLGLDDSEDCKVCVTESLLLVMHAGYRAAAIAFSAEEEKLFISVKASHWEETEGGMSEDEISEALLNALARGVLIEREDGRAAGVKFYFSK